MDANLLRTQVLEAVDEQLARRLRFVLEIDKLKQIVRRTPLLDGSRTETVAEHCWQISMMAFVLADYAGAEVNIDRVVRMLLVHDVVEIDAGDTFLYDEAGSGSKQEREQQAADRIFGLLPDTLAKELRALWEEFEERRTADARFAAGLDRLQPLLHNYFTGGGTWHYPGVTREKVLARKSVIGDASAPLWDFAQKLIADGVARGFLRIDAQGSAGEPGAVPPITLFDVKDAAAPMRAVADQYRAKYRSEFRTLTHFPAAALHSLHSGPDDSVPSNAIIASASDATVLDELRIMGWIANTTTPSLEARRAYFAALQRIYRRFLVSAHALTGRADTLCIGPEREGRMIAEVLGCLPAGRSLKPNAKRMLFEGGLLVGLDLEALASEYRRCVIIDGAIASGVTLMAIIDRLCHHVREFHVFSAHATASSLRALNRFCAQRGVEVTLVVGHASGRLNERYYALDEDKRLVVGDLGDMISPVAC